MVDAGGESCNLFPMAPVPSSVVTAFFTVPSPVNCPPCRFSPSHPVSVRSSLSPSFHLLFSNLSTSGQPHLLACPQDINRIQRFCSYSRTHHCVIYTSRYQHRSIETSIGLAERERSDIKCEKCEAIDFAENSA